MRDVFNLRSIQSRLLFMCVGLILVSVLVVASLSISTILQTGQEAKVAGSATLRGQAQDFLLSLSVVSAKLNDQEVERIRKDAANVAAYAGAIFDHPEALSYQDYWPADQHMASLPGGQRATRKEEPVSSWVPNFVRVDQRIKSRLEQMAYLDFIFAPVYSSNPDTVAIYMITPEATTRAYPNINLGEVLEPDYNLTSAIFHTLGTPQNDPQRATLWTPVYDDPAGQGLLVTAVAPVYSERHGFEGTIGIDLTLKSLVRQIETTSPVAGGYSFLIDRQGRAIALPDQGYRDILGRERAKAEFGTALADVKPSFTPVLDRMKQGETGFRSVQVDDRELFVAYSSMPSTGWSLAHVVEADNMLRVVNELQAKQDASTRALIWWRLLPVGLLILIGAAILAVLAARRVIRPIQTLAATAQVIQAGGLTHQAQPSGLKELDTLAHAFNNMTARLRQTFDTLQASEAKYRSLFENSKDAIFITSVDGKLVDMNPAGLALLGILAGEIHALNVADLYADPADRRRFREEMRQHRAISDFEVTMRRRDGSQFDALITATLRLTEEGAVIGFQGIIRDITVQKHNERLQAENLRLSTELDVTRRLQRMLLPKQHELLQIEGLEIAGYMQPADEVGGDYYDVLRHNGHVKIGIGDVTGHGLESGVLMLMTQMGVRTLLTHDETDPVQFIDVLNRAIYDNVQRMEIDKNLTLALLDYVADPQNGGGQLKASGQHEELILVRRGGLVELVNTLDLGFPIGLDQDIAGFVNQITLDLQPGDGVVLYTDGITEAENLDGQQYGLERLCALISQRWAEPADAIKEAVIADVGAFIGAQTVFDDITLLVIKQK